MADSSRENEPAFTERMKSIASGKPELTPEEKRTAFGRLMDFSEKISRHALALQDKLAAAEKEAEKWKKRWDEVATNATEDTNKVIRKLIAAEAREAKLRATLETIRNYIGQSEARDATMSYADVVSATNHEIKEALSDVQ